MSKWPHCPFLDCSRKWREDSLFPVEKEVTLGHFGKKNTLLVQRVRNGFLIKMREQKKNSKKKKALGRVHTKGFWSRAHGIGLIVFPRRMSIRYDSYPATKN